MKLLKKLSVPLIVALLCVLTFSAAALAASSEAEKDGLSLTLETDLDEYENSDEITAYLSVQNFNSYAVSDVALEIYIPQGYSAADGTQTSLAVGILEAGETAELTAAFIAEQSEEEESVQENGTESDTLSGEEESVQENGTESDSLNGEEENAAAQESSSDAEEDDTDEEESSLGEEASAEEENTEEETSEDTQETQAASTADNSNAVIWIILIIVSASGIIALICINRKWLSKIISVLLAAAVIAGSFGASVRTNAQESESGSVSIETTVRVSGEDVVISGLVTYGGAEETAASSLEGLESDLTSVMAASEEDVIFTVTGTDISENVYLISGGISLAEMNDDGTGADETAGDGIYTCEITIAPEEEGSAQYYAAAGDVLSESITITFFTLEEAEESRETAVDISDAIEELVSGFEIAETDEETAHNALEIYNSLIAYLDELEAEGKIEGYTGLS